MRTNMQVLKKNYKRIIQIIKAILNCLEGYMYKMSIDVGLLRIPSIEMNSDNIIVSLTSYERRVKNNVVYYTLCSILRQKVKPDRIVLWLDENEWSDDTLPRKLLSLKEKGVSIEYCENLKSYKKLVPSLKKYPESTIITVDDDCIYPQDTLEQLLDRYRKHPHNIICLYAMEPIIQSGCPANYKEWNVANREYSSNLIFPIGAAGILYPPHSLHEDACNKELFNQLCPSADDIWFWFNSLRNNIEKTITPRRHETLSFDLFYQYMHNGSSLTHINKKQGKNDLQFVKIFNHFNISIDNNGFLYTKEKDVYDKG